MVLYCDEIEGTPIGKKVQMMDRGARSRISIHVKKKKDKTRVRCLNQVFIILITVVPIPTPGAMVIYSK